MNFKEYDNFIDNHKYEYDMLHFIIYYNLKCNCDLEIEKLTDEEIKRIIELILSTYMASDQRLDLLFICDKLVENVEKIIEGNWTKWNLLDACLDACYE